MAVNARIIRFYTGEEPDRRGRYLHEIQQWPDGQLEAVHDYIQWLFPLPEPSGFNVAAPVVHQDSIREFRTRPELQQKLPRGNRAQDGTNLLAFVGLPFARTSLSPSRTPSPGELAWDFHVPRSDRSLLRNTLKVGFRQFDWMATTSGFRRLGMVRGSKRDQEMSSSALHNRLTA